MAEKTRWLRPWGLKSQKPPHNEVNPAAIISLDSG
jgi:hypothetical protein